MSLADTAEAVRRANDSGAEVEASGRLNLGQHQGSGTHGRPLRGRRGPDALRAGARHRPRLALCEVAGEGAGESEASRSAAGPRTTMTSPVPDRVARLHPYLGDGALELD